MIDLLISVSRMPTRRTSAHNYVAVRWWKDLSQTMTFWWNSLTHKIIKILRTPWVLETKITLLFFFLVGTYQTIKKNYFVWIFSQKIPWNPQNLCENHKVQMFSSYQITQNPCEFSCCFKYLTFCFWHFLYTPSISAEKT
jgi:hypothetical protein